MKTIQLNGQPRTDLGKKSTKQLRKEGLVPCILYGNKAENVHFTIIERDLKNLIYTPFSHIVEITIDGKMYPCALKEAQYHPVNDNILHLDFINVDEKKPITIDIPISVTGNSEGVKQGGKLQILNRKLKVVALLKDLPDTLPVDITNLGLGKAIAVADLSYDNITILTPKANIVCAVKMTRAAAAAAAAGAEQAK